MWEIWAMCAMGLVGVLCVLGIIAIAIQWRKGRAEEEELAFRIKAVMYFTLYFYTILFLNVLIPAIGSVFFAPDTSSDSLLITTEFWAFVAIVVGWGALYPPVMLLYFSVETAFRFWKGASIILSGKATKALYTNMIPDSIWLLFAGFAYALVVLLYEMEGFIWITGFLLVVILKEYLLKRKK